MSFDDYKFALKSGQKAYREAISAGNYPYLPALEDITSFADIETEMHLGLVEIPVDRIVGTKTIGRQQAFATNFMPLLDLDSEFAVKWSNLSTSMQCDGLREPIKAYEYMNYYYVLEGNKRVSVMKYFEAVAIPAYVIRQVPKRTDTLKNRVYFEFLEFYNVSRINYVYITKTGAYRQLLAAVGNHPDAFLTADECKTFHAFFVRFQNAYNAKSGVHPPMDAHDALLIYLHIYPYASSKNHLPSDFKANLNKSWGEFLVANEDQAMALSMEPSGQNMTNIITNFLIPNSKAPTRVAFINDKSAQTSGWTYGHELGRLYLEQQFPDKIQTEVYNNVDVSQLTEATRIIEQAIENGSKIVFTTTPRLLHASLKAAIDHPNVKILNCSLNTTHPYVRTYYARMYEAKFLLGAIAGAMSETNTLGYIADYPIYGMIANINAFALGAKMINPRIKIHLEWTSVKGSDIHEKLKNSGACFISDRDSIIPNQPSRQFGLYREIDDEKLSNIATPVWHWGKFYELILRSIMSGTWKNEETGGIKAINYRWGLSSGVIDVICSQNLPIGTQRLVQLLKDNICLGTFNPFSGRLWDQNGEIRHDSNRPMSPEEILTMDWLVENIVGSIPTFDGLIDEAKPMVALQGINVTDTDTLGLI